MDIHTAQELKAEVARLNQLYRVGTPEVSDAAYDEMVEKLSTMVEKDDFDSFRATLTEEAGKVVHHYKMGSLAKLKVGDDGEFSVKRWIEQNVPCYGDGTEGLFVSSKIDGCSACLHYEDGRLVSGATRGDGKCGFDITRKVLLFAPVELKTKWSGYVRGEVTLTRQTLGELSELNGKTYKNLRNATAGLINSKDATDEELATLRFFAYEVMGEGGGTKKEQFSKLARLGFETALHKTLTEVFGNFTARDYDAALEKVYNEFLEVAQFDIDGVVVSGLQDDEVFEDAFIPTHTVAVKFNQYSKPTQFIDIAWDVSKNGTLHPIGVVSPVALGGSTVSNVTLNNINFIKEMGLAYGCTVQILKSGDVIPKLVGVSHPNPSMESPIEYPTVCPSCGSAVACEDGALFPKCTNPRCRGAMSKQMLHMLRQLGIKNMSTKSILAFNVLTVDDLLHLKPNGTARMAQFIKDVDSKFFGASKDRLLCSFDFDGVSDAIIGRLVAHFGLDRLLSSGYDELSADLPKGIGEAFLRKFCDGLAKCRGDYERIISDARYHGGSSSPRKTATDGPLGGKGFVVTGELKSMSRGGFRRKVEENGGIYQSGVSGKTAYLVCNDRDSGTTKIRKAESLGVKVIDESEFLALLRPSDGFSIFD